MAAHSKFNTVTIILNAMEKVLRLFHGVFLMKSAGRVTEEWMQSIECRKGCSFCLNGMKKITKLRRIKYKNEEPII